MTVAELKNIIATMNDTDTVVFQTERLSGWSYGFDGYKTVEVSRITTDAVVKAEKEAEEAERKATRTKEAEEAIAKKKEAIKRCRSEKSIKRLEDEIIWWEQFL